MSIMNFFRNLAPTSPQTQQQQVNPAATQQNNNSNGSENSNNTVPSETTLKSDGKVPAIPTAAEGDASPLANYKDLWKTPTQGTGLPSTVPTFTADPKKLDEISKTIDFTRALDKTLVTKAATGDAEALMAVINQAAQAGYAQASGTTASLIEAALKAQNDRLQNEYIPEMTRRNEISREMRLDNKLYLDPAIAPMLTMVEKQFASNYPNSSPQEIRESAMAYLQHTASAVVSSSGRQVIDAPKPNSNSIQRTDPDWERFFTPNPQ